MGQAKKIRCFYCNKLYFATRSDSKWCSQRCRSRERGEAMRFKTPKIPQSGVKGVTFHRYSSNWIVKWKNKYVGSFGKMEDAIAFRQEINQEKGKVTIHEKV